MGLFSYVTGLDKKIADTFTRGWHDFTGQSAVDKQNEYNLQMWNLQNQYNTPANQMARYREAGLNPNLIYGNGSSSAGNATSAPELQAHQPDYGKVIGYIQALMGLKKAAAENRNINAQTASINADIALKTKNLELRDRELGIKSRELDILDRTGMRPGYGSALLGLGSEFANELTGEKKTPVERVKGSARVIRNAIEAGLPTLSGYDYSGRGHEIAIKAANKRGLKGKAREEYIRKVEDIYRRAH